MSRDLGARSARPRQTAPPGFVQPYSGVLWELPVLPPTKDEAACCNARRDHLGRLPIGYCSPDCERRPA